MARKKRAPPTSTEPKEHPGGTEKVEGEGSVVRTDDSPPLSDLYELVEFRTVRKSKRWWTVVMVVKIPSGLERLSLYRYQYDQNAKRWKKRSSMNINSKKDLVKVLEAMKDLSERTNWREK